MKYVVIAGLGSASQIIAVKRCMDDALDVIRDMENFDEAEGMYRLDYYRVNLVQED